MPTPTRNRPGITRTGVVHDDGTTITVAGWALCPCAIQCRCHNHPTTGQLAILQTNDGDLGLISHRPGGCGCCQPWTADELASVLRDLHTAAGLATA